MSFSYYSLIENILDKYFVEIFLCLSIAVVILMILSIVFIIKTALLKSKIKKLLRDNKGSDISLSVENYYKKCEEIEKNFENYKEKIDKLEKESNVGMKKTAAIRYNAFGEKNSNMSFAFAVLDKYDDGFVFNSIHSRSQTATYLKPIKNGNSVFALADEEYEVVRLAKENYEKKINNR